MSDSHAGLQARLWALPDSMGSGWPDLQSLAAGLTVAVYVIWLLKPMPINLLGTARFVVFGACVLIACAAIGNSGLMVWGQQLQQWAILAAAILQAIEWRRKPPT